MGRQETILKHWLTIDEASTELEVSRATLYRWHSEGTLPMYKLPSGGRRIRSADLESLLQPVGELGEVVLDGRSESVIVYRRFPADEKMEVGILPRRTTFDAAVEMPPHIEHRIIPVADFKPVQMGSFRADPRMSDVSERWLSRRFQNSIFEFNLAL